MKLIKKERISSRLVRKYSPALTPVDRVLACEHISEGTKVALRQQRATLDPFQLSKAIETKLDVIRDVVCTKMPKSTGKGMRWQRPQSAFPLPPSPQC